MKPTGPHAPFTLASGSVEIAFMWAGDRWTHRITTRTAGTWQSVEGPRAEDGDPRWPASPVLVELSTLATAGGPAILGVGLAGRSHFSASIVPQPSTPDTLLFEIACRLQETPAWLGSSYWGGGDRIRVAADSSAIALPGTAQWAYTIGPAGLQTLALPGEPAGA